MLNHQKEIPDISDLIETEPVECLTFDDLLPSPAPLHLDLLQIDAEGYDDEILRLFFASGRTASIVCFEHKHLSKPVLASCLDDLIRRGYRIAMAGPDTIAYSSADKT